MIAFLAMQAVPNDPLPQGSIATETLREKIELPSLIQEAVQPYFDCLESDWVGVSVTSAAQALAIKERSQEHCAGVRTRAKQDAIARLRKESRLSPEDSAIFVEAVLGSIERYTDGTKFWIGQ